MSEGRSARAALRRGNGNGRRLRAERSEDGSRVVPLDLELRAERTPDFLPVAPIDPGALPASPRRSDIVQPDQPETSTVGRLLPHFAGSAFTLTTFVVMVVIPTVLTALFYIFLATDQYATQSYFAVRSPSGSGASSSLLGVVAGISGASSSESADSYIILDFINSRELIEDLEQRIDLRAIYDRPEADFYYRFDPTKPIEDFVDYLKMMIVPEYNTTSNVVTLTVRAFRPEDAQLVAENVIAASERLINEMSRRAREDTLRESRDEVARAEQRLRLNSAAIAAFRRTEADIDPTKTAGSQLAIISRLESDISAKRAELKGLRTTMSATAPRVVELGRELAALEEQLRQERDRPSGGAEGGAGGSVLTDRLTKYEELQIEQKFAQEAYTSALASLEAARMNADRQQRYISVFVSPRIPQYPLYPEGLRWTGCILGLSLILWGLVSIIFSGVKDHFV